MNNHNWTVDRLLAKHPSLPFNPDVANAFFHAGKIEAWGSGIERIFKACAEHGCPEPTFQHEAIGLMTTLPFSVVREETTQETDETTQKTREKTREKIVQLIANDPQISMKQLADELRLTSKGVEWQIRQLKQDGIIERIGSARGGSWKVVSHE